MSVERHSGFEQRICDILSRVVSAALFRKRSQRCARASIHAAAFRRNASCAAGRPDGRAALLTALSTVAAAYTL